MTADAAGSDAATTTDAPVRDAASPADAALLDAAGDAMAADADVTDAPPARPGVSTLAGGGATGTDDGFGGTARFSNPANVTVADDGTIYVADFDNGLIRAVTDSGNVTTLTSQSGFARPFGMDISNTGVLWVQTDRNSTGTNTGALWSINTGTGVATLVIDNSGRPRGFTTMTDGRLVMAYYQEHVVKVFDPSTPTVAPVVIAGTVNMAGMVNDTGAAARFTNPYDVVAASPSEVIVSDRGNHVLRRVNINTGVVTTFAGEGTAATVDGIASAAQFNVPQGLAIDDAGVVYVSELGGRVIRKVSGGNVVTVAGDGTAGHMDSTNPLTAQFFGLEGIDIRADGSALYVADGNRGEVDPYNRVRRIELP